MKKTQTKDTIGRIVLSLLLLFLGEGLFSYSWYWPVILGLGWGLKRTYWYGFVFGLLISGVTRTPLGLASLIVVSALFLFGRLRERVRANVWLVGLVVVGIGLVGDRLMGLSWTIFEGVTVFLMTGLFFRLNFFGDDLSLSSR